MASMPRRIYVLAAILACLFFFAALQSQYYPDNVVATALRGSSMVCLTRVFVSNLVQLANCALTDLAS